MFAVWVGAFLTADGDGDVHFVALRVGECPPLGRAAVVDDSPPGAERRIDTRAGLVIGHEDIDVDAVALLAPGS
jgi:hypothetical protein